MLQNGIITAFIKKLAVQMGHTRVRDSNNNPSTVLVPFPMAYIIKILQIDYCIKPKNSLMMAT